MTEPVVRIRNLTLALPKGSDRPHAVEDLSLDLMPGKILCVVGESGSGKSMSAYALTGLLPRALKPVGGEILFDPHVVVRHVGGTSGSPKAVVERHKARSFRRYFRQNFPGMPRLVRLALEENLIAEGAGALALAAGRRVAGRRKFAVVSGGNIDATVLASLLNEIRPRAPRKPRRRRPETLRAPAVNLTPAPAVMPPSSPSPLHAAVPAFEETSP